MQLLAVLHALAGTRHKVSSCLLPVTKVNNLDMLLLKPMFMKSFTNL